MPGYRRDNTPGGTWFFTVATYQRKPVLTHDLVREALRNAIKQARRTQPFRIDAWVLLPDHLHCVWTLPQGDSGFSVRWSIIKRRTSQALAGYPDLRSPPGASRTRRQESTLWQRRFWEHRIRDSADMRHHIDYIHWNPVKHGLAACASDWPWSSFHRYVHEGVLTPDWGGDYSPPESKGFGE